VGAQLIHSFIHHSPTIQNIFRVSDIRGVWGDDLDEGAAYLIGRAIVVYLKAKRVLVGRDMRTSSIPLCDALVRGIRDQGADVIDMGLCSTPMFYWATQKYEAGVMVTASHNPPKYNGFKICRDGVHPVWDVALKELEQLVLKADFPACDRQGSYSEISLLPDYIKNNLSFLKTDKKFRIVVDAGNGMGGYVYDGLMKHGPKNLDIIPMYFELDGTFPNHEANPLKSETCKALQQRVLAEKADLGVALDGDGDRIFFIDEKGQWLCADFTTVLIAKQVLAEHPHGRIVYGICQSRIVREEILASGGVPILCKVGHAFYKTKMLETGAAFGAEHSGHFFNAEQQNTENTQVILFRLLNLLAKEGKMLSEAVEPLRRYVKMDEVNFTVKDGKAIMERLRQEYAHAAKDVITLDGLRMEFEDWWFAVRPSNNEPLLRLNLECKTDAMLRERFGELSGKITRK
jgi:phosphomannomutase